MFSLAFLALLHHHLFYLIHCPMLPVDNRITFNPFILNIGHLQRINRSTWLAYVVYQTSQNNSDHQSRCSFLFTEQNSMLTNFNMRRPLTMNSQTELAYNHLVVGLYLHFVKCFLKQINQFVRKMLFYLTKWLHI